MKLIGTVFTLTSLCFATPLAAADKPKPCSTPQYRHFDFWLGSWTVKDPAGKVVGHSEIKSILNGCAISESWTSVTPYKGVSYNFYDQAIGQWHQTWIGVDGAPLYLNGALEGEKMVLSSTATAKDGSKTTQRITWTPLKDGRISQHWQVSTDAGKSWKDSFLGFYEKNK